MRSGKLRHTVTLQSLVETQDSYGSAVQSWADYATVRASVEPLQGREYFASQQVRAEATTRFRIRYLSGVLPTMRVVFDGRAYNIESIINLNERNRELHLMAVEVLYG